MKYTTVDLARDGWKKQPRAPRGAPGGSGGQWVGAPGGSARALAKRAVRLAAGVGDTKLRLTDDVKVDRDAPLSVAERNATKLRFAAIEKLTTRHAATHAEARPEFWDHVAAGVQSIPAGRAKKHREILDELVKKAKAGGAKADQKILVMGGLPGAGKGTILKAGTKAHGHNASEYITIDPDAIKEIMAEKGMIPAVGGLKPMERASVIHEEASFLAKQLTKRASDEGLNILLDGTLAGLSSSEKKIRQLEAKGYSKPSAIFVDVPVSLSTDRAFKRYRRGMSEGGVGGRPVPLSVMESWGNAESGVSQPRANLDIMVGKGIFADVKIYDQYQNLRD